MHTPCTRSCNGCLPPLSSAFRRMLSSRCATCVSKKHVAPQEASLSSVYGCCRATNLRPLHSPRVYCSALIIRRVTVLKTGTALASPGLYNSSVPSTDSPTKRRFNGESVDCTRRASDVFALQFTRLVGRGCACGHLPRFFFFRLGASVQYGFSPRQSLFLLPLPLAPFTRVRVLQSCEGSSALCFPAGIAFPAQAVAPGH